MSISFKVCLWYLCTHMYLYTPSIRASLLFVFSYGVIHKHRKDASVLGIQYLVSTLEKCIVNLINLDKYRNQSKRFTH